MRIHRIPHTLQNKLELRLSIKKEKANFSGVILTLPLEIHLRLYKYTECTQVLSQFFQVQKVNVNIYNMFYSIISLLINRFTKIACLNLKSGSTKYSLHRSMQQCSNQRFKMFFLLHFAIVQSCNSLVTWVGTIIYKLFFSCVELYQQYRKGLFETAIR